MSRCDICGYRDGKQGSKLHHCKVCRVPVHDRCYGMPYSDDNSDFVCWACQSVGKSFEAVDEEGAIRTLKQKKRPTKCDLCDVAHGIHAMHPLYDNHGKSGRQIMMKDPKPRLSWAHSLCAFYLSCKSGVVYGCNQSGEYEGADDDDATDDDRPINPTLMDGYDEDNEDGRTHHFVHCKRRPNLPDDAWTKSIHESQNYLKCFLCGKVDSGKGVLRIAVQCCANDDDEYEDCRDSHIHLLPGESCTVAMHIGCAKYGEAQQFKRVFFFPGSDHEAAIVNDPVTEVFCTAHAKDVAHLKKGKREDERLAQERERQGINRGKQHHPSSSGPNAAVVADRTNSRSLQSSAKRVISVPDSTPLPSLQRMTTGKTRKKKQKSDTAAGVSTTQKKAAAEKRDSKTFVDVTNPLYMKHAARSRPGKKKFEGSQANAVATTDLKRTLLKTSKDDAISEAKKLRPLLDAELEEMRDTMLPELMKMNVDDRRAYMQGQKAFWKRRLSLPSEQFIEIWKQQKAYLREELS
mmetsp:Transcript_19689/g.55626  ORF Transcript_19689/g.55626 Transcript_19689/m.55626 type:complete len:519 (+) Transcript_19689:161-1717(+)